LTIFKARFYRGKRRFAAVAAALPQLSTSRSRCRQNRTQRRPCLRWKIAGESKETHQL